MLPHRRLPASRIVLGAAALLLLGCPPAPRDEPPTQAPAILIPPTAVATPAPTPVVPAPTPAPAAAAASTEKTEDMVYNLGGFDPVLTDAPNDQKGKIPSTDLLSAHAVIDKERMYVRLALREEMPKDNPTEIRFWLEQGEPLVTVEVKIGSQGRPCELSAISGGGEEVVQGCYFDGNPLDLSFPLSAIPSVINVAEPFHVSGFQTCCMDEARNDPYDEVQEAQEVFRVGWPTEEEAASLP